LAGAVYVKVMVQPGPGHPERLPQSVVLPRGVLLMKTSTPAPPPLQVSVPVRSVAPMILDVIVVPIWIA